MTGWRWFPELWRGFLTTLVAAQAEVPHTQSSRIEDVDFGCLNGPVRLRIVRPLRKIDGLPVVVYFRGWLEPGTQSQIYDRLVQEIAERSGAAVISIHDGDGGGRNFCARLETGCGLLMALEERGEALGLDMTRLAVAGDGIGGAIAAALCWRSKERGGPDIRLQILLCPAMSHACDTPSYKTFAAGPWLTTAVMRTVINEWSLGEMTVTPNAYPLIADFRKLENLPPAIIITAENDVLRDEGETYARKLMQAGVNAQCTRYVGTIHDFVVLNALAESNAAAAAISQVAAALDSAFSREGMNK
ncbi:alpha/beta hydrolase fold domain-containing protein [Ensifer sp. IC4062]|nr:alpha/beta hydrolase [Ensifer sp. IC4062]MCA1443965.1 alpha/beta hydrolase fold domain-containing protein [Ensifer sp. IC4062]